MSKTTALSTRYSEALFQAAEEVKAVDSVYIDTQAFLSLLDESPELLETLKNKLIPVEELEKVIESLFSKAKLHDLLKSFSLVLIRNGRQSCLIDILKAFQVLVQSSKGELAARVQTASPLRAEQKERLESLLEDKTGLKVHLHEKVDPTLLGGVVVNIGSYMIDTSLKAKLRDMQQSLESLV